MGPSRQAGDDGVGQLDANRPRLGDVGEVGRGWGKSVVAVVCMEWASLPVVCHPGSLLSVLLSTVLTHI